MEVCKLTENGFANKQLHQGSGGRLPVKKRHKDTVMTVGINSESTTSTKY